MHNDSEHSLEFLTVKVKTHALKRILANTPHLDIYKKRERSRLEAIRASAIGLIIVVGGAWYLDHFIANIIAGALLVVFLLPKFLSRLFDPHTTRSWSIKTENDTT